MSTSRSVVQTGRAVGQHRPITNTNPLHFFRQVVVKHEPVLLAHSVNCFSLSLGQSVGGALNSAKSVMSSWFSTLSQPALISNPQSTTTKQWPASLLTHTHTLSIVVSCILRSNTLLFQCTVWCLFTVSPWSECVYLKLAALPSTVQCAVSVCLSSTRQHLFFQTKYECRFFGTRRFQYWY